MKSLILTAAAVFGLSAGVAFAAPVISPGSGPSPSDSVGAGSSPAVGLDAYQIYTQDNNSNLVTLTRTAGSYVSSIAVTPNSYNQVYPAAAITVDGTPANGAALSYDSSTPGVTVTIVLSNTVHIPSEFRIGLLAGNEGGYSEYFSGNSFDITDTTGGSNTLVVNTTSESSYVNNFYYADVSGASAGDTITIDGTFRGSEGGSLGGVTFDTVVGAPEPASLGLLALGGVGLLARRRRHR